MSAYRSLQIMPDLVPITGAPAFLTRGGRVRPLVPADLPELADCFGSVFRRSGGAWRRDELVTDLDRVYVGHPETDPDAGSLVYERFDGTVGGFIGILPQPFRRGGTRLAGSLITAWMVADRERDPEAGPRLIRTHFKRRHPITFSDTANRTTMTFRPSLKMALSPIHSLEWVRPLELGAYALSLVRGRVGSVAAAGLDIVAPPLRAIARGLQRSEPLALPARITTRPLDTARFAALVIAHGSRYRVAPDWSVADVIWRLETAATRRTRGPLRLAEVLDETDGAVGAFAYQRDRAGQAICLQMFALPDRSGDVLRAFLAAAAAEACVVARGQVQPHLVDGLLTLPMTIFRHAAGTILRAAPEIVADILAGDGFIGGLAGEGWSPLVA